MVEKLRSSSFHPKQVKIGSYVEQLCMSVCLMLTSGKIWYYHASVSRYFDVCGSEGRKIFFSFQ